MSSLSPIITNNSVKAYNTTTPAEVCASLVTQVQGYPQSVIQCQINAVLDPAYPLAGPTQTYQGQMWWPLYPNAPQGIEGIAIESRNAFLGNVRSLNATSINSTCSDTYAFSQPRNTDPYTRRKMLALLVETKDPRSDVFDVPGLPLTKVRL